MQSRPSLARPIVVATSIVFACASLGADGLPCPTGEVQYQDDFDYATGGRQIQVNGVDPTTEGDVHGTMYTYGRRSFSASDELKLVMTEDDSVNGPDGQPGVLRLEFAGIPLATDFSGFVVTGCKEFGGVAFPGWTPGEVTVADLDRTFISFRFRAENRRDPQDFGLSLSFRLEPQQEDSLFFGADFGTIIATSRWRTMKRPIGSAKNLEAFRANLNNAKPERFKLVWSQSLPAHLYQSGDSLLIDDLRITIE